MRTAPFGTGVALALLGLALAACSSRPTPTMAGVAYAGVSKAERLNLYLPKGAGPFPLVIMIHGGGFAFGSQDDVDPGFANDVGAMNGAGIAVASIGYRLSGEATFPAAVQDVKAAIRFLRAHAAGYRLAPGRFALWGKSAGANLALLGGLAHHQPLFDDPALGDAGLDDHVQAIVAFYPPVDFLLMDRQLRARGCQSGTGMLDKPHDPADSFESRYLGGALRTVPKKARQSNPIGYVTTDAPPVYLSAGTADCTVPPDQSRMMMEALQRGAPASGSELHMLAGARHVDPVFDEGESLSRVRVFLERQIIRKPARPQPGAANHST